MLESSAGLIAPWAYADGFMHGAPGPWEGSCPSRLALSGQKSMKNGSGLRQEIPGGFLEILREIGWTIGDSKEGWAFARERLCECSAVPVGPLVIERRALVGIST